MNTCSTLFPVVLLHSLFDIPILQAVQNQYRYLPKEALRQVCELTEITRVSIMGVSTFYDHFRHRPVGRHMINVCTGTACHVKGANLVEDAVRHTLEIAHNEDTTTDNEFTSHMPRLLHAGSSRTNRRSNSWLCLVAKSPASLKGVRPRLKGQWMTR